MSTGGSDASPQDDWQLLEVLKYLDELEAEVDEFARLREACPEEHVDVREIEEHAKSAERAFVAIETILTRNMLNTLPLTKKPLPPLPKRQAAAAAAAAGETGPGTTPQAQPASATQVYPPLTLLGFAGAPELKAKLRDPARAEIPHRLVMKAIDNVIDSLK